MDVFELNEIATRGTISFSKNWKVILYNDPTTYEGFILDEILCGIFKYGVADAYKLMKHIEETGQQVIAVLPKKLAEVRVKHSREKATEHGFKDFKISIEEE